MVVLLCINAVIVDAKRIWVVDPENFPLTGVVISIVTEEESEIKNAVITDKEGLALLSDSVSTESTLYAQLLGFKEYQDKYKNVQDTIYLQPTTTELSEIVVMGNKDITRAESGKIIFTPGSLKTQISNALDILKYVPLISDEDHNSFKVLGKNCHILINGKEPQVSQDQVMSQLKSVPAEWIQSIEIIPNQGSAYNASGNLALVNVRMTDLRNGAWVSTDIIANIGDETYGNADSGLFYYTHKKFKVSAYGSYQFDQNCTKSRSTYNYILSNTDNNLSISNINKQTSQSQNTRGEFFASYQINKKNRIGGGLSISADKHNENNVSETSSLIQSKIDDDENRSSYVQPWSKPYLFYKLYYLLATDSKGSFLDISGIYRHGRNESNAKYNFSPDADEWRSNNTSGGSATISYTQIFNQKHTLKGGYNFQTTKNRDVVNSILNSYVFNYEETIHSEYIQLESIWNQIVSSTLGLRIESAEIDGEMTNGVCKYNRTDTDLFPSVNINLMVPGGNHYMMLSAERSIFRPQFYDLNPYILWTSQNTCVKGNPELKATTIWNFSAMYLFLQNYIVSINYSLNKDLNSLLIYGEDGISFTTRVNRPSAHNYHIAFEYNKQLCNIWRLRAKVDGVYFYSPFYYGDKNLTDKALGGYVTLRNRLSFSQKFVPNIDLVAQFGYRGQENGIGKNWIAYTKLAFSKEIIPNLDLDFSVSYDPIYNLPITTIMEDYNSEIKKTGVPVSAIFNLTYSFGRKQINKYKGGGDDSYNSRF